MKIPLTKLEILLTTALLIALIGVIYLAYIAPAICPLMLKDVIQQCNFLHEKELVNKCYQSYYTPSSWDIRDYMNSTQVNKTLNESNLSIDTGIQRLNRRLNLTSK